jgi:hypothetical protein
MKSCYEVGCLFADKKTGTCDDECCVAHPVNVERNKNVVNLTF